MNLLRGELEGLMRKKTIVATNKYYLTFNEVCKNFHLTEQELQLHIRDENIVPAIFYFLNNGTPDYHIYSQGGKIVKTANPRIDIPNLPALSRYDNVVYLHGILTDTYPKLYEFVYVALTPSHSSFHCKDNMPVEIYKLGLIPHTSDDAKEHFVFAVEEVERFKDVIPDRRPINDQKRDVLIEWIERQPDSFDPFDHKYTKERVYEGMNLIDPIICRLCGASALNLFFQGKKGRFKGCKDLIKFTSEARNK